MPRTDEHYPAGLTPQGVVEYISREKADAAVKLCTPEEVVITADTMVFLDDQRLGKPRDEAHALEMLTALQGHRHTVCTGVTVRPGEPQPDGKRVHRRDLPSRHRDGASQLYRHRRAHGQGRAYGVPGKGALLVERLEGDFFNVMGLPVLRLSRMLAQFGIRLL